MDLVVKIDGLADCEEALKLLPEEMAKNVVTNALKDGATVARAAIANAAPVGLYDAGDPPTRARLKFGPLRGNIVSIRRRKLLIGQAGYIVGIGNAFWGAFQEFGTRRMPARPWMRPAWEGCKDLVAAVIHQRLADGIERAAKRFAKKIRF